MEIEEEPGDNEDFVFLRAKPLDPLDVLEEAEAEEEEDEGGVGVEVVDVDIDG